MMVCFYWILKLKARFLSGDYDEALAAADKAKSLLWSAAAQIQLLDYFLYAALTVAALYEKASDDEQTGWRDLLTAHENNCTSGPKSTHRLSATSTHWCRPRSPASNGRDTDAMRLYEQAIQSAREHGFVQNEALAHEVAARFYAARGFETIAHAYLRNAMYCYLRWGAEGKVRQLEQLHPHLREHPIRASPSARSTRPSSNWTSGR